MNEITLELTDYCPNSCKYCSSSTTNDVSQAIFLNIDFVKELLDGKHYDRIILSGGEPLSHPDFYKILQLCKEHSDDVIVYTNEMTHVAYNPSVIDGIYVEANLTVLDNVQKIHVLKRVEQGRERKRPEVMFSKNFVVSCDGCGSVVVLPDGRIVPSPCKKN